MEIKEARPYKTPFRLLKPGTLFQDSGASFWIKTGQGDSLFVKTGEIRKAHSEGEKVIPYPNAIILPEGETK